jgi:hypothetical protein
MGVEMRFRVTPAEQADIEEFVARKRLWAKPSHFFREAVFAYMSRNKPGGHHPGKGQGRTVRPSAGDNSEGGSE